MKKVLKVLTLFAIYLILVFTMSLSHVLVKEFIGLGLLTIISDFLFIILIVYVFRRFGFGVKKKTKEEKEQSVRGGSKKDTNTLA